MIFVRKLEKGKMKLLKMKEKDKLAFVHETLYNTGPVRMTRTSTQDGSISAKYQKFLKLLVKVSQPAESRTPHSFHTGSREP